MFDGLSLIIVDSDSSSSLNESTSITGYAEMEPPGSNHIAGMYKFITVAPSLL